MAARPTKLLGCFSLRPRFRTSRDDLGTDILRFKRNDNDAIYRERRSNQTLYGVSDLGATFGATEAWPVAKSKDNFRCYAASKFIINIARATVDFHTPHRDSFFFLFTPRENVQKGRLLWIGHRVPRGDSRWIGVPLRHVGP